jgi:cysteinyl-tRNA synthetase
MRVGTVRIAGEKMAKSTGNLVFVSDLVANTSGPAVRMLLLDRRWDAAWDYDPVALTEAANRLDRLHVAAGRAAGSDAATREVLAALADDLDVPRAIDIATDAGGAAARDLVQVLAL